MSNLNTKNSFWSFNIGHFLTLSSYVVTASIFFGVLKTEVTTLKKSSAEIQEKMLHLEQKLSIMDTEGTSQQRTIQNVNDKTFTNHEQRLQKIEEMNSQLSAKLSSLDGTLNGVSKDVSTIKEVIMRGSLRVYNESIK